MTRRVAITGVGAVTPLGVGARRLHERWCDGRTGIEDGVGPRGDFDADRLHVGEAGAPHRPLHAARGGGRVRGARRAPAGTASCPTSPIWSAASSAPASAASARSRTPHDVLRDRGRRARLAAHRAADDGQRRLGRARDAPRRAGPGLRGRLCLRGGRPRDRRRHPHDPARRRRRRDRRRVRGRADRARPRGLRRHGRHVGRAASRGRSTRAATAS